MSGGGNALRDFEQFLEKATVRSSPSAPPVSASALGPTLEAFVESAGMAVHGWTFEPPTDGPIAFDTVVQFASGKPTTTRTAPVLSPAAERFTVDGALRVGGAIKPPTKIRDVKPVYPPEAKEARVQGVVIAEVLLDGEGRVAQARILRSIPMLDEAALEAIRQWQFTPTLMNGAPVPVLITVTMQFTLPQ